jgi:hypothetical protein
MCKRQHVSALQAIIRLYLLALRVLYMKSKLLYCGDEIVFIYVSLVSPCHRPQRPSSRTVPPGKTRYPLYRRLGRLQRRSGQVWKISPPTGIGSPGRPAHRQSLYRLRYPAHEMKYYLFPKGQRGFGSQTASNSVGIGVSYPGK